MLCSGLTREQSNLLYAEVIRSRDTDAMRRLCREDLFFLLTIACRRHDINHPWLYARCREVEAEPDGYMDLWAREHYKSTIITYGKTIQDILIDPEDTFGIFSHTRPIAKAFLEQIKRELETNTFLQGLFPDILYANPSKESPKWSLDGGILVKRKSNPKEATVEAWGLVDGQPTSKHFRKRIYDDVVTKESITSPEMIEKTTNSWELSLSLGAETRMPNGSTRTGIERYSGTRYHHNDTYKTIIERGSAKPRYYYPTDIGQKDISIEGRPVLLSPETLLKKRKDMGLYTYGCQMLQDPTADKVAGFKIDWLNYYTIMKKFATWNFYLLVDPASEKKKDSDFTVMAVIAMAEDGNYYLMDGVRDRMNLTERTVKLFELVRKWPIKNVGYEKYGMQADIEHIQYVQELEGYRFKITPLGGAMPKNDRIRRLVPIFEQGRFFLPVKLLFVTHEKKASDFVHDFVVDEYTNFPVCAHDDMLDCVSRICDEDLNAVFPKLKPAQAIREEHKVYDPLAVPSMAG